MKKAKLMLAALLVISPLTANADIVTWEATGSLTVVDTSGGSITEFPTAAVGTPFTLTFTFDSSAGLSSTTMGANGTRYRYIDAPLSVELTVGGTGLGRAQQGFASIDIWDDFTFAGSSDPASDGFNLIWGVESSQVGGVAQNSLILRGPETLNIFSGPGLPTTPSPQLTSLSLTVVQLIDGTDGLVGNVESVSRVLAVGDTDGDSVNNDIDLCPTTLPGDLVDANGCSANEAVDLVVAAIFTLIDSPVSDKARDKLGKAQDKLGDALAELEQGDVKKALKKIGDAVKELTKAEKEGADVANLIEQLVELARAQAQAAIDDAVAAGGDPKEVDKALKELGKAQDELAKGKPDKAIDKYAKAWDLANKA